MRWDQLIRCLDEQLITTATHQLIRSAQPSSTDSLYLEVNVSLICSCVLFSSVFTSTCDFLTSRFYQWWILETRVLSRDMVFMFLFWRSLDSNLLYCLGSVSNFDVSLCLMPHMSVSWLCLYEAYSVSKHWRFLLEVGHLFAVFLLTVASVLVVVVVVVVVVLWLRHFNSVSV